MKIVISSLWVVVLAVVLCGISPDSVSAQNSALLRDINQRGSSTAPALITRVAGKIISLCRSAERHYALCSHENGAVTQYFDLGGEYRDNTDNLAGGPYNYDYSIMTSLGSYAVFFKYVRSDGNDPWHYELWRTDGSSAGTGKVYDFIAEAGFDLPRAQFIKIIGESLYFLSNQAASGGQTAAALWRTDGSAAGTQKIQQFSSYDDDFSNFEELGGALFFSIGDNQTGATIWRVGGVIGALTQLRTVPTQGGWTVPLHRANNHLYFLENQQLFQSDGTVAGTAALQFWSDGYEPFVTMADEVTGWFCTNAALTQNCGIYRVASNGAATLLAASSTLRIVERAGTKLYLRGSAVGSGSTGESLWVASEQANSAQFLANFTNILYLYPVASEGRALFTTGATWSSANQVWATDGTPGGTQVVFSSDSLSFYPRFRGATRTAFYKRFSNPDSVTLVVSDGTLSGTVSVAPELGYNEDELIEGDTIYYRKMDSEGAELWSFNMTDQSGNRVSNSTIGTDSSYPREFVKLGNRFLFTAYEPDTGIELWSTDGTTAGTNLVRDIYPGPRNSGLYGEFSNLNYPTRLLELQGQVYFFMSGSGWPEQSGLWATDGTAAGTRLVKSLDGYGLGITGGFTVLGSRLMFVASEDIPEGGTCNRLWSSDGSTVGTISIADDCSGPFSSGIDVVGSVTPGRLMFIKNMRQIWITDGTVAGTSLVFDGQTASEPLRFESLGASSTLGKGFLAASSASAISLFASDGTAAGTMSVMSFPVESGCGDFSRRSEASLSGREVFQYRNYCTQEPARLIVSNGTAAGTPPSIVQPAPYSFQIAGIPGSSSRILIGNENFLWSYTVGDSAAVQILSGIEVGQFEAYGSKVLFADIAGPNCKLWASDGTAAGTVVVRDFGAAGWCTLAANHPQATGRLFLSIYDASAALVGAYLTDGTTGGTAPVPSGFNIFLNAGSQLGTSGYYVFAADDPVLGNEPFIFSVDDQCVLDPNKLIPGICGCGLPDDDTDGDGIYNCFDGCASDAAKTSAGQCGCGVSDVDADSNGTVDCKDIVLAGRIPAKPSVKQVKKNVVVQLAPLEGVRYVLSITTQLPKASGAKKAPKKKTTIKTLTAPTYVIKAPKVGTQIKVQYTYQRGGSAISSSGQSGVASIKVKAVKGKK